MLCPAQCVPEGGHAVAGGPAHDEAPLWGGAPLTHLLDAAGGPHLAHSDLGLHLEMSGRPTEDTERLVRRGPSHLVHHELREVFLRKIR